jgi:hypothetical protein
MTVRGAPLLAGSRFMLLAGRLMAESVENMDERPP